MVSLTLDSMYLQRCYTGWQLLLALIATQGVAALPATNVDLASTIGPSTKVLERRYYTAAVVNDTGADWTVEVTIGGQKLNLLIDTGSSDT